MPIDEYLEKVKESMNIQESLRICSGRKIDELTIELNNYCPQNCIFCSSKNCDLIPTNKPVILEFEDIMLAIRLFNPDTVRFSGGEPLKRADMLDKFTKLLYLCYDVEMILTTSGYLYENLLKHSKYNPNWILPIDSLGRLDKIRISILGFEGTHNYLTGKDDAWDRVMKTLEILFDVYDGEIEITAPAVSEEQVTEVKQVANYFNLETRITGLVPPEEMCRPNLNSVDNEQCSLGGEKCKYNKKRLILPNFKIINCAVEKLGFDCPYQDKDIS